MSKTQLLVIVFVVVAGSLIMSIVDAKNTAARGAAEWERSQADLAKSRERIRALEAELTALKQQPPAQKSAPEAVPDATPPAATAETTPTPAAAPDQSQSFRVRARISAIEKFVPLNDEQRARLEEKFQRDVAGAKPDEGRDELAEIIGEENAEYYRKETRRAFERAESEEREKDVLLLSRRLGLNAEQEAKVTEAMVKADSVIEEQRAARRTQSGGAAKMEDRLRSMIADNNLRQKILNEQLEKIFSAEQYRLYLEQQQDSTEGSFPVWHESE